MRTQEASTEIYWEGIDDAGGDLWHPILAKKSSRMGCLDFCCTLQQRLQTAAEPRYRGRGIVAWPSSRASSFTLGHELMAVYPAIAWQLRPASFDKIAATNQPICYFLGGAMVSLAALATRNLTTVLALILMVSPV